MQGIKEAGGTVNRGGPVWSLDEMRFWWQEYLGWKHGQSLWPKRIFKWPKRIFKQHHIEHSSMAAPPISENLWGRICFFKKPIGVIQPTGRAQHLQTVTCFLLWLSSFLKNANTIFKTPSLYGTKYHSRAFLPLIFRTYYAAYWYCLQCLKGSSNICVALVYRSSIYKPTKQPPPADKSMLVIISL